MIFRRSICGGAKILNICNHLIVNMKGYYAGSFVKENKIEDVYFPEKLISESYTCGSPSGYYSIQFPKPLVKIDNPRYLDLTEENVYDPYNHSKFLEKLEIERIPVLNYEAKSIKVSPSEKRGDIIPTGGRSIFKAVKESDSPEIEVYGKKMQICGIEVKGAGNTLPTIRCALFDEEASENGWVDENGNIPVRTSLSGYRSIMGACLGEEAKAEYKNSGYLLRNGVDTPPVCCVIHLEPSEIYPEDALKALEKYNEHVYRRLEKEGIGVVVRLVPTSFRLSVDEGIRERIANKYGTDRKTLDEICLQKFGKNLERLESINLRHENPHEQNVYYPHGWLADTQDIASSISLS